MHAIRLGGRKTYLFAFIDDHSRAVMAARFGFAEDTIRLAAALRPALASRGIPAHAYVDNGSAFVDAWLLRACAKLGIKLIHSQPRRPRLTGQSLDHLPVVPPQCEREAWLTFCCALSGVSP
jgi:putative transposase